MAKGREGERLKGMGGEKDREGRASLCGVVGRGVGGEGEKGGKLGSGRTRGET